LCTHGEKQSSLHFAARSDAVAALKALLEVDANIERRDYKGRTPLQLAAELDRSESVRCLLEMKPIPANVGVSDYSGHMALTSMVATMPPVTKMALNQFHRTSKVYRKQLYYLNLIEKPPPG
jgi:ankyrin repeat protein